MDKKVEEYIRDNELCGFCLLSDECPHSVACYGGEPVEPPCAGLDAAFIDRNIDVEAIEEMLKDEEEG